MTNLMNLPPEVIEQLLNTPPEALASVDPVRRQQVLDLQQMLKEARGIK